MLAEQTDEDGRGAEDNHRNHPVHAQPVSLMRPVDRKL